MADAIKKTLTTGVGTVSFPHLSPSAADSNKNDKGEPVYDIQLLIPKSDRESCRAIAIAVKEVAESKFGENWRKVRSPFRDGDAEADEMAGDGTTRGQKYPERLGCYFINARSKRAPGVYDRTRNVITNPDSEVYGGCKAKISITLYAYSTSGNHGVGAGLNGVQKIGDGEPFGAGAPTLESMFDMLDEAEDTGLGDDLTSDADDLTADEPEVEVAKPAAKKTAAKRKPPAKKAAAPAPEPEVEDLTGDEDGEGEGDSDLDDLYSDLD